MLLDWIKSFFSRNSRHYIHIQCILHAYNISSYIHHISIIFSIMYPSYYPSYIHHISIIYLSYYPSCIHHVSIIFSIMYPSYYPSYIHHISIILSIIYQSYIHHISIILSIVYPSYIHHIIHRISIIYPSYYPSYIHHIIHHISIIHIYFFPHLFQSHLGARFEAPGPVSMSSSGSQRGSIIITIITVGWWFEHGTDSGKHLTTGWWFATWFLWISIYWECHHPNWRTPPFFRLSSLSSLINLLLMIVINHDKPVVDVELDMRIIFIDI